MLQTLTSILQKVPSSTYIYKILKDFLQKQLVGSQDVYDDLENLVKRLKKEVSTLGNQPNDDSLLQLKCVFSFIYLNLQDFLKTYSDHREKVANMLQKECFIDLFAIPLLNDFKENKEKQDNEENVKITEQILSLCLVIPSPSQKELKTNKIGRLVNKLAKESCNELIKSHASEVVLKWKKDLKERQESDKNLKPKDDSPKVQSESEKYKEKSRRDDDRDKDRQRERERDRPRIRQDDDRMDLDPPLIIRTKEQYSNSSNHSKNDKDRSDKMPDKKTSAIKKTNRHVRKIVRFQKDEKKLKQIRYFAIGDQPNAPELAEQDMIPLRETKAGALLKNISDMKRADMLREKTINANQKQQLGHQNGNGNTEKPKESQVEMNPKLSQWSTSQLLYVDVDESYCQAQGDNSEEIANQKQREFGSFQVIYYKEILIPTDPLINGTCDSEKQSQKYLEKMIPDFYEEWRREQEHIRQQQQLVALLCLEFLNTSSGLRDTMAQFYNKYNQDQLKFSRKLIEFYQKYANQFIQEEKHKKQQQMVLMVQAQQSTKNYRTVPCKMYHQPQTGYCNKGDSCHFIHEPRYKGRDIPRDELNRIKSQNMHKFTVSSTGAMLWQQQQQYGYSNAGGMVAPTVQNVLMLQNISGGSAQQQQI
ncbi:UNKNOWN [Stylonychia lemnae]|uniref:C3H1-type domain-containing protein n=1 Tax=Stylonychia lemnae TaxID=5949 RepID=A0A078A801_STYLE|nr:UNKNOWN [Stylonychia lemnae]|eukprot:CDW77712.1 UNKNOWN [Stylonychia lemnae]